MHFRIIGSACCFATIMVLFFACSGPQNRQTMPLKNGQIKTTGSIERMDSALNQLIAPGTDLEIIADSFDWSEGPLWIDDGNFLLFSDIPQNRIYKWDAKDGLSIYLQPSGYTGTAARGGETGSNGLILDSQNRLVMCQHGDRRMARMDAPISKPQSKFITLVDRFEGKRLNSPNDAVYKSNGDLYFTDPPYGLEKRMEDPAKELDFQGLYRLSVDGHLDLLVKDLSRPNGLAFSPDEKKLYVANSDSLHAVWMQYDVNEKGFLENGTVFYDASSLTAKEKGLPDGMKSDEAGNLYAAGPGGIWIFNPSGKVLGKIRTGQATSNCAFNKDQSALFITADMYLIRVKMKR